MKSVEQAYNERVRSMSTPERMRRLSSLMKWSRDFIARSIVTEYPEISETDLKWEVAIRLYGSDPKFRELVRECRHRASS